MSKASNQSIVLLSVIGGILIKVNEYKMFSVVAMKRHVDTTYRKVLQSMEDWPKTGNSDKNLKWIYKKLDIWGDCLHDVKDFHNLVVFAVIMSRCLADIRSQVSDKQKINIIKNLYDDIEKIHNFIDPNGANFQAYEKADELMDRLYEIIEWEWVKKRKF